MTKNNEDRRLLTLPIMFCIADCQMRNVNVRSVNSKRRKTPSSSCLWVSQFRCSFIIPNYLLLLPSYINYIVVIKRYDVIYYHTWLSNQQLWTRPLYLYTCRFKLAFAYIYIIIIYFILYIPITRLRFYLQLVALTYTCFFYKYTLSSHNYILLMVWFRLMDGHLMNTYSTDTCIIKILLNLLPTCIFYFYYQPLSEPLPFFICTHIHNI